MCVCGAKQCHFATLEFDVKRNIIFLLQMPRTQMAGQSHTGKITIKLVFLSIREAHAACVVVWFGGPIAATGWSEMQFNFNGGNVDTFFVILLSVAATTVLFMGILTAARAEK